VADHCRRKTVVCLRQLSDLGDLALPGDEIFIDIGLRRAWSPNVTAASAYRLTGRLPTRVPPLVLTVAMPAVAASGSTAESVPPINEKDVSPG
jgi:hypothetical protein